MSLCSGVNPELQFLQPFMSHFQVVGRGAFQDARLLFFFTHGDWNLFFRLYADQTLATV